MKNYPKISIVTVNYNNGEYLEDTLSSVINQGYPNLEYIVIDGASTDNSIEIIKKYEKDLTYWVSEPDEGQYAAIIKGFKMATGDILAWINSDDKYLDKSLFVVAEIFQEFPKVKWLTGLAREFREDGALCGQISLQTCRWSRRRYLVNDFQFIQQESTFWSRELWEKAGGTLDTEFDLAGDMELWARFFRHEKLYTTTFELAGFRHRKGQRSKINKDKYMQEARSIINRERRLAPLYLKLILPFLYFSKFFFAIFYFLDIPFLRFFHAFAMNLKDPIGFDWGQEKFVQENRIQKFSPMLLFGKQIHSKIFKRS